LLLRDVLHHDPVDALQALLEQPAVAKIADRLAPRHKVQVGRTGKDGTLAVATAELRNNRSEHARAALVIDVRVDRAQRPPHRGQAGMHEAQHRQAGIGAIGLVHRDAVQQYALRLPEVEADHRYAVTGGGQSPRQDALLDFRTPDVLDAWIAGKRWPSVRRNKADMRPRHSTRKV
jgi:hypothetical protein